MLKIQNYHNVYFLHTIIILAILIFLAFDVSFLTRAQDSPETPATFTFDRDEAECIGRIKNFMMSRKLEFAEFINQHFRSGKPTTELIPGAIERFRQYRKEVRGEFAKFVPKEKKSSLVANLEAPTCEAAIEEDFMLMKQMIRQHIVENAYAKKSTRLLDKYKEINEKLDKLNATIAQTAGYFGAFSQKLPCYATKCSKQ